MPTVLYLNLSTSNPTLFGARSYPGGKVGVELWNEASPSTSKKKYESYEEVLNLSCVFGLSLILDRADGRTDGRADGWKEVDVARESGGSVLRSLTRQLGWLAA